MTVTITRETVTPEMAIDWLGSQHLNRRLRPTLVKRYGQSMSAGEWEDTGEPIRFNQDETLIDGQHRLTALRDQELTLELWVARGLTHTAQAAIDTGAKRSVGDVFQMRGIPNAFTLGAAFNVLNRYWLEQETNRSAAMSVSSPRALELYEANQDIQESVPKGRNASKANPVLPPGLATALHYIFVLKDEDNANEFFERLTDGANLAKTSPIYVLRTLLAKLNNDRQRAGMRGDKLYVQAVIVKAWNAWRGGIVYTQSARNPLRWSRTGKKAEAFPRPA